MKNYPKYIKRTLHSVIRDMAKHPRDFCRCPGKDFTRDRKLPFEKLLTLLVKMGGHSLRDEMLDCLDFKETPASVSALVQQRSKLLPEALEYLFREFTNRCQKPKLHKGYRLLAVDGSDLQFTANPNDPLSYFPGVNGQKPYSFLHLNALYDLNSNLYQFRRIMPQAIFAPGSPAGWDLKSSVPLWITTVRFSTSSKQKRSVSTDR